MVSLFILAEINKVAPISITETVSGFSRYQTTVLSLPVSQRLLCDEIAKFVFKSFWPGRFPVTSVSLIGHADVDLQKGHQFEQEKSEERAQEVEKYLKTKIGDLAANFKAPPDSPTPADISWAHNGVGATQPAPQNLKKNPNTLSEPERALNRRVEVVLTAKMPQQPTQPWTFDPVDAQKKLQQTIDDFWNRRLHILPGPGPNPPGPPPPPPPQVPPWIWKDLKPLNQEAEWQKWRKAVKDWAEQNHIDLDPIMDTFKDILQLPDGSPGPIDADFEKELRRRRVLTEGKPDDDD
jgi:hypothetical protein